MRIKFFWSALVLLFSVQAMALEYENSLGLGFNLDTFKTDLPNGVEIQNDFSPAATLGYKAVILWGNIGLRTGAFFEFKNVSIKDKTAAAGKNDIDLRGYYAAVPVNLQFNLNDRFAVFGGIAPRILLAKTCDDCGRFDDDSKVLTNYYNAGISYMFGQKWGMDLVFNNAAGENFRDIKINTSQVIFTYLFN